MTEVCADHEESFLQADCQRFKLAHEFERLFAREPAGIVWKRLGDDANALHLVAGTLDGRLSWAQPHERFRNLRLVAHAVQFHKCRNGAHRRFLLLRCGRRHGKLHQGGAIKGISVLMVLLLAARTESVLVQSTCAPRAFA